MANNQTYSPTTWVDGVTELSADNLNKIEQGLETASDVASTTQADLEATKDAVKTLNSSVNDHTGSISTLNSSISTITGLVSQNSNAVSSILETLEEHADFNSSINEFTTILDSRTGAIEQTLDDHTGAKSNPHEVNAEQVNAYDKPTIDSKLSPVKTITVEDVAWTTFDMSDISHTPHNVLLEINDVTGSQEHLWSLNLGDYMGEFSTADLRTGYLSALVAASSSVKIIDNFSNISITNDVINRAITLDIAWMEAMGNRSFFYISDYFTQAILVLYNQTNKKMYFVPTPMSYSFGVLLYDDKLFYKNEYTGEQEVISIPEDVQLLTLFFDTDYLDEDACGGMLGSTVFYTGSFQVINDSEVMAEQIASIENIYKPGKYIIPYDPGKPTVFDVRGEYIGESKANVSVSYFKDNSNLGDILKLDDEINKLTKDDVKAEAQKELDNLISIGTNEPTSNTPGMLYFKYLP